MLKRETHYKNTVEGIYKKLVFLHDLFPEKWFMGELSKKWKTKREIVNDINREGIDDLIGGIFIKGAEVLIWPHHLMKILFNIEDAAISLGFSSKELPVVENYEDYKKYFRLRYLEELERIQNEVTKYGLINNIIKMVNLLGLIDEILKNLEQTTKFSGKASRYRSRLMKEPDNYFSLISEILTVDQLYNQNILEELEQNTGTGKKRPDLLIKINNTLIEGEVYAPKSNLEGSDNFEANEETGELLRAPYFMDQKEIFRDFYKKLARKLDSNQLSGDYPGILIIDRTFTNSDYIESYASLVNLVKKLIDDELNTLEHPVNIPEALSAIVVIDRKTRIGYFKIPKAVNSIEENIAKELVSILTKR